MAYDPLDETLRLIAEGVPEVPRKLSRRVRFAPLAVDVDGQFAASVFVRRGQGSEVLLEEWTWKQTDGDWSFCGGGGGTAPTEVLADRPTEARLGEHLRVYGTGSSLGDFHDDGSSPSYPHDYVFNAQLRVSYEVHALHVNDRVLPAPRHGNLIVVWASDRLPELVAVNADGLELARHRFATR